MKRRYKVLISVASFLLLCFIAFFIYTGVYYHAEDEAYDYLESNYKVEVIEGKNITFKPTGDIKGGIVFYPGAKVEHIAYSELMFELANNGYLCVLVKMPFNLAFFGINKADKIINQYDEITNWYMMGHSLGGAMISSYASKNIEKINGVILLSAYSTKDLSSTRVLSIYGSNDLVLNKEKYIENVINLPKDYKEVVIDGGNHTGFASYGVQKGDGELEITHKKQLDLTVLSIVLFLNL